ncbi:nicotinamide mononucleotide transporter [Malaciobacter molluscorum LMG 25693]|uniref:Nicotinamide riboside transporter PnuC n=1 Tax=Malaciobacter molluscorum LMG 25693 TaxID=870501 RepID=A0A2G1DIE5_9BACT|nr:nicotinamide mononucleotide transporter [Malaciobacter molluscorum LMG 25693]
MKTLLETSIYEIFAMLLSILYLILAIKQSLWCWPAAFISTSIYIILFFDADLLMDSFLNFYYLIMAIYGWYSWKFTNNINKKNELKVSSLSITKNTKDTFTLIIISLILGFFMKNYTTADYAYIDTFTTVFAIYSTYLLAKKVIENWIYWIIIDCISIYIYINKQFYLTAILFLIYTILAFIAYVQWKKEYIYAR